MRRSGGQRVRVHKVTLHDTLVGYLTGGEGGRNTLSFSDQFKSAPDRPTLSLTTHPRFPHADKVMAEPWVRHQRLHPVLSNLLPEGALREFLARVLKIHIDDEFRMLSHLGRDLPGAIIVEPMAPDEVPDAVLRDSEHVVGFEDLSTVGGFSLAGVQMKFSMKAREGRFNMSPGDGPGEWIVKTPSTRHDDVPANEFTAMTLAAVIGVDIPEIRMVPVDTLDSLPAIKLSDEQNAFAIKRFDRRGNQRVHMEDFAQVLVKYPHEKYGSASYEQIGKIIYRYSGDGLADVQQFARRLLANILLANGDAHIKNWSLLYPDRFTPRLSPAYDILTTCVYIDGEKHFALNLGKTKAWHEVSFAHFEHWARKADVPWRAIKPHLDDAVEKARALWPEALEHLPMNRLHKKALTAHWGRLHPDFVIDA
ncbi:type II toxin-antitoxin system HipA family toxin [Allohahella marinimesophila]|uniref:Type II toxin-antitoxin system HipA family toxin n=1 Tax=Allohahella marinimesophila TaxID=1054972 RepID=A0ABP7PZ29_9GAMM